MRSSKKKLLAVMLSIVIAVIIAYFFILPACAMYFITKAHRVDVWHGRIDLSIEDSEGISELWKYADLANWKRDWTVSNKQMPDVYILVDQSINIDLAKVGNECHISVYFHSSRIEIASYQTSLETLDKFIEYLSAMDSKK